MNGIPIALQEQVLTLLDAASVANWALTCSAARNMVRVARTEALSMLRGPGHALPPQHWMLNVIRRERQRACKGLQVSNATLDHPDRTHVSSTASWDHSTISGARKKGYAVYLDADSSILVDRCLELVAGHAPEFVSVMCLDDGTRGTLADAHLRHLRRVPFVAILGHAGVTDAGLAHLADARVLWVGGCTGLRGDTLPSLVYTDGGSVTRLLSIKWIGGWGRPGPFHGNATATKWLATQEEQGLIVEQW